MSRVIIRNTRPSTSPRNAKEVLCCARRPCAVRQFIHVRDDAKTNEAKSTRRSQASKPATPTTQRYRQISNATSMRNMYF